MSAIVVDDVAFAYRPELVVLERVDLTVDHRELLRLVGENGSGKSTLLRLLAGHLRPTNGRVAVLGHDASSRAGREARWFMEASPLLYGHLTVREQVHFYCRLHGTEPTRVLSSLGAVGLDPQVDTLCVHLSSGQRRKLWFMLALLAHDRSVVLLDEPFNDVDRDTVPVLTSMLSDHVEKGGSVVLSTHVHVDEVMRITGAREHRLSRAVGAVAGEGGTSRA